jgi:DNA-binding IclR family transcriptional regulator
VILTALRDHAAAGGSWWSATNLARHVRLPPERVRRALAELAQAGWVERGLLGDAGRIAERWRLPDAGEARQGVGAGR